MMKVEDPLETFLLVDRMVEFFAFSFFWLMMTVTTVLHFVFYSMQYIYISDL